MPESITIKPQKNAFYFSSIVFSLISLVVLVTVSIILAFFFHLIISIVFFVLFFPVLLFHLFTIPIKYKKEEYTIYSDKIIAKRGGLFSDFQTELIITNITHITLIKPYLERIFFNTGLIQIESAGSMNLEINLRHIAQSDKLFSQVLDLMKKNGFSLKQQKTIQKEQPSVVGIFINLLSTFASLFFTIIITFFVILGSFIFEAGRLALIISLAFLGLAIMSSFVYLIFRYLDLKRRKYIIYDDSVTYYEGFLTTHYSIIPAENISDSHVSQNLLSRIFEIYDIKISCQGSGNEISFTNMPNGEKFEKNLDTLIASFTSLIRKEKKVTTKPTVATKTTRKESSHRTQDTIKSDTSFTTTYKIHSPRLFFNLFILVPIFVIISIFFPLIIIYAIFVLVPAIIYPFIAKFANTYYIKEKSVEHKFSFINKQAIEFSNEKVTGVVFTESIIDKLYGTISIQFWSIGSAQALEFSYVKKTPELVEQILKKFGVDANQKSKKDTYSHFSLSAMFKASLFVSIFSFIVIIGSIVFFSFMQMIQIMAIPAGIGFLYVCAILYSSIYFKTCKLSYFNFFMRYEHGIFIKKKYYVLYNNIKDVISTQYPFSTLGRIEINVAGGQGMGPNDAQNKRNIQKPANTQIRMRYIKDVRNEHFILDEILYDGSKKINSDISINPYYTVKPMPHNSVFTLSTFSVIVFPLIVLLPITIPLTIISVKKMSYSLDEKRIFGYRGIFFKSCTTILYNRIDHVNKAEGFTNKLFKNGTIAVFTVGSPSAEMIAGSLKEFNELYDKINEHY